MKFCKNLQRVVDISDPEWAPYWTNYKMLKVRPSRGIAAHFRRKTGSSENQAAYVDISVEIQNC
jgi:hypothetical protein